MILGATDPEYVPEGGDIAVALLSAGAELSQLVTALGQERKTNPTDDLTSALLSRPTDDAELMSEEDVLNSLVVLFGGGYETTAGALGNGIHALLTHPEQFARLTAASDRFKPVSGAAAVSGLMKARLRRPTRA